MSTKHDYHFSIYLFTFILYFIPLFRVGPRQPIVFRINKIEYEVSFSLKTHKKSNGGYLNR